MDYDKIILFILLGQLIMYGIEIALCVATLETSEMWYVGIKGGLFFITLTILLFPTSVIKDDKSNLCYNEKLTISSYNIQDDYIYLYGDNDVKIYPIVDGVNITDGECE